MAEPGQNPEADAAKQAAAEKAAADSSTKEQKPDTTKDDKKDKGTAPVTPTTPITPEKRDTTENKPVEPKLTLEQETNKKWQEAKNLPDVQKNNPDRSPLWRSAVSRTSQFFKRPDKESQPLEREKNRSKAEEINDLVDKINSFQFEMNMRSDRFREISGQNLIGRIRAFVGGESRWVPVRDEEGNVIRLDPQGGDFEYIREYDDTGVETGGTLRHSWEQETNRKIASVSLRTARTAGLGLATAGLIGVFTGGWGLGAAFLPALAGSTAFRGIFEGIRAAGTKERRLRGELEAVRIRYFQEGRELASRVGPEWTPDMPEPENDYNIRRNAAIESLVNFVYSYEELGVEIKHEAEGNIHIQSEVRGEPIPLGTGIGDPSHQGGPAGPSFVQGVELIQPSDLAPDARRVRDIEDDLAKVKSKWDKWEEVVALAGGLAGSAYSIIHGGERWIGDIYNGYRDQLMRGEGVKLHIDDNPLRGHVVQRVTDATNHLKDTFVYHLRGLHEQFGASDAGAKLMNLAHNANVGDAGQFGSHLLEAGKAGIDQFGNFAGDLGRQINYALWQKSVIEAIGYVGKTALMLGGSFGLGWHAREGNERNLEKYRDTSYKNQEQWRRRLQPETILSGLAKRAEALHLVMPKEGQTWTKKMPGEDQYYRIKILRILETGDAIVQYFEKDRDLYKSEEISIQDIMDNYLLLTPSEDPERVYPSKEGSEPSESSGSTPGSNTAEQTKTDTEGDDAQEDQETEPEPETKEEEKKEIKVTIKAEQEAAKEINLENGQIFSRKIKGKTYYFEILINDNGSFMKKAFKPKADGSPEYTPKYNHQSGNLQELQGWLNGQDIKQEAQTMNEFTEIKKKKP